MKIEFRTDGIRNEPISNFRGTDRRISFHLIFILIFRHSNTSSSDIPMNIYSFSLVVLDFGKDSSLENHIRLCALFGVEKEDLQGVFAVFAVFAV